MLTQNGVVILSWSEPFIINSFENFLPAQSYINQKHVSYRPSCIIVTFIGVISEVGTFAIESCGVEVPGIETRLFDALSTL